MKLICIYVYLDVCCLCTSITTFTRCISLPKFNSLTSTKKLFNQSSTFVSFIFVKFCTFALGNYISIDNCALYRRTVHYIYRSTEI